jgi:hypothetical protein
MPKVEFTCKRVTFPPCEVGHAAFSTVCFTNAGDTAIRFNFPEHYRPLELPSSKPQVTNHRTWPNSFQAIRNAQLFVKYY